MRMWMVNPKIMCRQHLIGEYRELFTFIGTLKKGTSVNGYIMNDLLEISSIYARYEELKQEMLNRGYNPVKTIEILDFNALNLNENTLSHKIDRINSFNVLMSRCNECRDRNIQFQTVLKGGITK